MLSFDQFPFGMQEDIQYMKIFFFKDIDHKQKPNYIFVVFNFAIICFFDNGLFLKSISGRSYIYNRLPLYIIRFFTG